MCPLLSLPSSSLGSSTSVTTDESQCGSESCVPLDQCCRENQKIPGISREKIKWKIWVESKQILLDI